MEPKIQFTDIANFSGITLQGLHKQVKTRKIEYHKKRQVNYLTHNGARELLNLKVKPSIIAFEIVKGGVGKTTLSFHCAVRASLYGLKCALIDLDQQANLTHAFGARAANAIVMDDIIHKNLPIQDALINVSEGIDLLPSNFNNSTLDTLLLLNSFPLDKVFKKVIEPLKQKYDLIFIDCPPALGAAVAASALASDFIIAPLEPDEFSMEGLNTTLQEIANINKRYDKNLQIKISLNKFNLKTTLSNKVFTQLINNKSISLFKTLIRASQEFPNALTKHISIFDTLRATVAKEDIDAFTREIIEMVRIKEV